MASREVTGKTVQEIAEMRVEYEKKPRSEFYDFEDYYCLAKIPRQPDDYDGPPRYCTKPAEPNGRCRFHGGASDGTPENLEKLANLKHSMYAKEDTIRETMDDEEEELYEWVMSWADVYDIDFSEDPSAYHDLQTLAIEIVRQARTSDYILANTEVTTEGVYTPDGQLLEEKEVPNSLVDAHQRQIRLIQKIKDTLNITRKQQKQDEQAASATEVMDNLAGAMSDLVGGGEYDPDE